LIFIGVTQDAWRIGAGRTARDVRVAGFDGGGSADEPSKTTIHGRKFETAA